MTEKQFNKMLKGKKIEKVNLNLGPDGRGGKVPNVTIQVEGDILLRFSVHETEDADYTVGLYTTPAPAPAAGSEQEPQ